MAEQYTPTTDQVADFLRIRRGRESRGWFTQEMADAAEAGWDLMLAAVGYWLRIRADRIAGGTSHER